MKEIIKVKFIETLHLPRFVMKQGEIWECRKDKQTAEGFKIGGGFAKKLQYKIIG
jgi:hypothetical protein